MPPRALGAEETLTPEHLREAVACSRCQAISPHGGSACSECGTSLAPPLDQQALEEAARSRRAVAHSLRRGYRRMTTVTWLYRAGAVVYAGVTVVAILALSRLEVPQTGGLLVVGLTTTLTVLMLAGAIQIAFKPFLWTALLAALATTVALVHLFGPDPFGLMFIGTALWALAFWAMLPSANGFRRLIAQYTDEYVLHHASLRTRRTLRRQSGEERHARLVAVMRRAAARAWKVSATASVAVVVVSALSVSAVLSELRPHEFADSRASFEAAWNSGELGALDEFITPELRRYKSAWLGEIARGHGWGTTFPPLAAARIDESGDRTRVHYTAGGLALSTAWVRAGREWHLIELELPEPPLEPVLDEFRAAWGRSDLEAIAGFFPAGYRERMYASMQRSAGYRSWDELPEILGSETTGGSAGPPAPECTGGETLVKFQLEHGVVTTKWLFHSTGNWGLQAFVFPER